MTAFMRQGIGARWYPGGSRVGFAVASLGLVVIACLTQVRTFPRADLLGPDSGVFAYGGQQVLFGRLPYVDFWDHKPPVVFYVDALSIALLGPTARGFWVFGTAYLIIVALAMMSVLARALGTGTAFVASAIALLTLTNRHYFDYANLTEVYALVPQVLTLGVGVAFARTRKSIRVFVLGLLTSACFLTRQTTVGLGISVFMAVLLEPSSGAFLPRTTRLGLVYAAGLLIPIGLTATYWASHAAFGELWAATMEFNQLYSGGIPAPQRVYGTLRALLLSQPLGSVALLAVVAAAVLAITRFRRVLIRPVSQPQDAPGLWAAGSLQADRRLLLHASVIALPIELYLASPGGSHNHYYITAVPAISLAATFIIAEAVRRVQFHSDLASWWSILGLTALGALAIPWALEVYPEIRPAVERIPRLPSEWRKDSIAPIPEAEYIAATTAPNDSVLFWGYLTAFNVATGRRSPTRYTYPAPLLMPGYGDAVRWREFMRDLEDDPPALIVGDRDEFFMPGSSGTCAGCTRDIQQGMEMFSVYVFKHYQFVREFGDLWVLSRTPR